MTNHFKIITFSAFILFSLANFTFAQKSNFPVPREETLLNGLKVLIVQKPNTGRVSVDLRIHSGSAFDQKNKEGTMALLTDITFPDEAINNFFVEELGGTLAVKSTFDYIEINSEAKASEVVTVLETLVPAISNTAINKEITAKAIEKKLLVLKDLENNPEYIADTAVAERLLGDYPYGRRQMGSTESLKNIDFADLIFLRDRFFAPDNATLVISGDVDSNFAYKAARRLFGGWLKRDEKIPATFRLPLETDSTPLEINTDEENATELRFALNSVSRRDKDFYAVEILTEILNERLQKASAQTDLKSAKVENHAYFLRGFLVFSKNLNENGAASSEQPKNGNSSQITTSQQFIKTQLTQKITPSEFDQAKSKVQTKYNTMTPTEFWFEIDTYKLGSVSDEFKKINNVKIADVQKVAADLSKNKTADVSVYSVAGDAAETEEVPDIVLSKDPNDPR